MTTQTPTQTPARTRTIGKVIVTLPSATDIPAFLDVLEQSRQTMDYYFGGVPDPVVDGATVEVCHTFDGTGYGWNSTEKGRERDMAHYLESCATEAGTTATTQVFRRTQPF